MKYLCVKLIVFYQKFISPVKPPSCRFYPSCSEYARQAFLRHGFLFGLILSVYRILRCNPFCRPGLDMVPEKIFRKKKEMN
ncbi:MAG: membrane protein insertion efficiency factor YidD [Oscillospiraceae bacterium]|nr:membrane protein insertion efficiency factor YidD [Oscillospiraceae bacterium]